ncbi:unnamed protein product [Schistosoma turkestanicum]|nr:unnamed protein product [Schistosoma turkestanicum]
MDSYSMDSLTYYSTKMNVSNKQTDVNITHIEDNFIHNNVDNNNNNHVRRIRQQFQFDKTTQRTDRTHGTGLIGHPDAVHYTSRSEIILYNLYAKSGFLIQIRAQNPNAYCPYSSPIFLLSPKYNTTVNTVAEFNHDQINETNHVGMYSQSNHVVPISTSTLHSMHNQNLISPPPIFNYQSFENDTVDKYSNWNLSSLTHSLSSNLISSATTTTTTTTMTPTSQNPSVLTIGLFLSAALTTIISIILLITLIILCVYR